jgi:hypothetical protein
MRIGPLEKLEKAQKTSDDYGDENSVSQHPSFRAERLPVASQ